MSFLFASACVIILSITSTLLHYISFLSSIQRELQNVNFLHRSFLSNLIYSKKKRVEFLTFKVLNGHHGKREIPAHPWDSQSVPLLVQRLPPLQEELINLDSSQCIVMVGLTFAR